jgi:hypothetical protein
MMCEACKTGGHAPEDCEHPATCTCQHKPPQKLPTLDEVHERRKLAMNAEVPPGDC